MTPEEKGALLLAAHEGKKIEWSDTAGSNMWCESWWRRCGVSAVGKFPEYAYRVRPGPVVVTVTRYGSPQDSWGFTGSVCSRDTHVITFNLVDGKPDCNSIKMEET